MTDTELDLTPREPAQGRNSHRGPSLRNGLILGTVIVVLGLVLFQALTEARVFFYNVDEAVAKRDELGDAVFRMQGTVVDTGSVDDGGALVFTVAFNDERAEVRHIGEEPSTLFDLGLPVVVEGRWRGESFESTQVLVKHSEAYVADNPDRVDYELDDPLTDS